MENNNINSQSFLYELISIVVDSEKTMKVLNLFEKYGYFNIVIYTICALLFFIIIVAIRPLYKYACLYFKKLESKAVPKHEHDRKDIEKVEDLYKKLLDKTLELNIFYEKYPSINGIPNEEKIYHKKLKKEQDIAIEKLLNTFDTCIYNAFDENNKIFLKCYKPFAKDLIDMTPDLLNFNENDYPNIYKLAKTNKV